MPDVKDIISQIRTPLDSKDETLIRRAFDFAAAAHGDQKRYSGEPYFIHVFETAKILAELGMGPTTIAAGLLHDTLEDAAVKPEIIEKEFDKEILFLVDGVTKLGKLRYRGAERHLESLRKFFVAMAHDLRVLIIKLADRLHNMRTLNHVPAEKQGRIANETLEVYASLAYRLSMRKLSREFENLAFPYVYPKESETVKALLKQKTQAAEGRLGKFGHSVVKALAKEGLRDIRTETRTKSLYSLWKKLLRKGMDMEKIHDFLALRIIVPTVADCYRALGIIHAHWRPLPGRIKDYIAVPKPNGYQSIHTTIFTGDGGTLEIQIRTEEMHQKAEYGVAAHLFYKEGPKKAENGFSPLVWLKNLLPFAGSNRGNNATAKKDAAAEVPEWIRQIAEIQKEAVSQNEFLQNLETDFFQYRVFVFTPKGDVIDLPLDSSPIDFAYAIHSDIGDHIAAAKVNGKMVSLDTALKNGDIVEIITKDSSRPSAKWLEIAKTAAAKKKIRAALENLKR